jgi:hypothetical protein
MNDDEEMWRRDYFATRALACHRISGLMATEDALLIATNCYLIADAMMLVRGNENDNEIQSVSF